MRTELTGKRFFNEFSNEYTKMNYYWFNKEEILQKAKEKYSKEKATEYYKQNKEAIKENSRERYKKKKTRLRASKKKVSRIDSI